MCNNKYVFIGKLASVCLREEVVERGAGRNRHYRRGGDAVGHWNGVCGDGAGRGFDGSCHVSIGSSQLFFHQGPGQYGTGNQFLGFLGAPVRQVTGQMQAGERVRREKELQQAVKDEQALGGN